MKIDSIQACGTQVKDEKAIRGMGKKNKIKKTKLKETLVLHYNVVDLRFTNKVIMNMESYNIIIIL